MHIPNGHIFALTSVTFTLIHQNMLHGHGLIVDTRTFCVILLEVRKGIDFMSVAHVRLQREREQQKRVCGGDHAHFLVFGRFRSLAMAQWLAHRATVVTLLRFIARANNSFDCYTIYKENRKVNTFKWKIKKNTFCVFEVFAVGGQISSIRSDVNQSILEKAIVSVRADRHPHKDSRGSRVVEQPFREHNLHHFIRLPLTELFFIILS